MKSELLNHEASWSLNDGPLRIETLKPLMILSSILWRLNLCSYLCQLGRSIQYSSFSRWEVRVKVSSLLKDMLCKAEQSFSILCLFLVMLPDFCSTGPQLLSYQRLYHWVFYQPLVFTSNTFAMFKMKRLRDYKTLTVTTHFCFKNLFDLRLTRLLIDE